MVMRKALILQTVQIVTAVLLTGILFSSCRYMIPGNKQVISDIAVMVNENYSSDDVEIPYYISMTEIDELADKDRRRWEKYQRSLEILKS